MRVVLLNAAERASGSLPDDVAHEREREQGGLAAEQHHGHNHAPGKVIWLQDRLNAPTAPAFVR